MEQDLELFVKIVKELEQKEKEEPVITPQSPQEFRNTIDISLNNKGISDAEFSRITTDVVLNSPRSSSNKFFNQLFGGRKSKAVLGDLLSVVLNTGLHTYKVNGIQVLIEREIINTISQMIEYTETAGGIFTPGGSMSNFQALLMARDLCDPKIKQQGVTKKMTAYLSDQSHYSMVKNIRFAGIGEDNLRKIPTNIFGQLDSKQLEATIQEDIKQGYTPFFVKATAGTTVLGAFDPIEEIADICKKYDIWLHVDGALGGSVIFSEHYKHLVTGLKRADSFALNAHKMLNVPISCSMVIVKNKHYLFSSFNSKADYLYQGEINDINPGMMSLQCARKNDALKLWTLWKSIGTQGLGKIVDTNFKNADIAREYVRNHPDYTLYNDQISTNVCFNYKDYSASHICNELYKQGTLMVGHGTFENITFIRLVTVNSNNTEKDILDFFAMIEENFK